MMADPAQADAAAQLERVHAALVDTMQESSSWFGKLFAREREPIKGLYLYGGVGRGKTWLMDLFYAALPFEEKLRAHFYQFMARVHQDLTDFRDEEDPLELVALKLAKQARVICFDEFFVSDIGDAMILGRLLEALFERRVVLVATSNARPEQLYRDGLQRARFLPAIELLNANCVVHELASAQDFRLRALDQAALYLTPLGPAADRALDDMLLRLSPHGVNRDASVEVDGRALRALALSSDTLMIGFDEICETARAPSDYVEIARRFATVMVANVPELDAERENAARRFIAMVDAFYDQGTNLIVSAARPIATLYTGAKLGFEFARTQSRLVEMGSAQYLQRAKRH